jgi:hypothetical protein
MSPTCPLHPGYSRMGHARYVLADKGYDADPLRRALRQAVAVPVIPVDQAANAPSATIASAASTGIWSKMPSAG